MSNSNTDVITDLELTQNDFKVEKSSLAVISFSSSEKGIPTTHGNRKSDSLNVSRDLKEEKAVKKTRLSTEKFPFKCNQGWLNFNSLAAASS